MRKVFSGQALYEHKEAGHRVREVKRDHCQAENSVECRIRADWN